jgi:AcrR family transcriptional regulator
MPRIAASERDAFVEKRREEITAAALELFAERGYAATPVASIARKAGLSKGSFYLYFPTKLALLEAVFRQQSLRLPLEQMVDQVGEASLDEVVHGLVRTVWAHLQERKHLVLVLIRELPSQLPLARHFMDVAVLPTNQLFAAFLAERLGEERAAELCPLVAGRGLIGMVLVMFITQEVLGGAELHPLPEDEILNSIAELFLHGVKGRPGQPA